MANVVRVRTPRPAPPTTSPYDLLPVSFGGDVAMARPYEFDSEPVGDGVINSAGTEIKPTKAIVACPKCGAGQDVVIQSDVRPIVMHCAECGAGYVEPLPLPPEPPAPPIDLNVLDPFRNPIISGVIPEYVVNSDIANIPLAFQDDGLTAAQRLQKLSVGKPADVLPSAIDGGLEPEDA